MSDSVIPYSQQSIGPEDIQAVVDVLQSRWLTTGPAVERFERTVAEYVSVECGVAFSSGTAALHAMLNAIDIAPGDEVIVPAITFVATANAVLYQGGTPIFADVDPNTLLLDPADVARKITPQTKAIIGVDYAGQPCDYRALRKLAARHGLYLLSDASHALGASIDGRSISQWTDMTVYSFHPVKPMTTAEGGMVTTDNPLWAAALRRFRGHGIDVDFRQRAERVDWRYQQQSLGYNYRMSDLHAALGVSQLSRLDGWQEERQTLANEYRERFAIHGDIIQPLVERAGVRHAYHLFVIRWSPISRYANRDWLFSRMRAAGIGVNVHYQPVYQHPYYQQSVPSARKAKCPNADAAIHQILSLPIFPGMSPRQMDRICHEISESVGLASVSAAAAA